MPFAAPPRSAAWEHREARSGFEVVFLRPDEDGCQHRGPHGGGRGRRGVGRRLRHLPRPRLGDQKRAGVGPRGPRAGASCVSRWCAPVAGWSTASRPRSSTAASTSTSSPPSLTNAFPVHHLGLEVGQAAEAPAAYVRALDLAVERLEQRYLRLDDEGDLRRYHYTSPAFDFECELVYDASGLVLDYPGIAVRAA